MSERKNRLQGIKVLLVLICLSMVALAIVPSTQMTAFALDKEAAKQEINNLQGQYEELEAQQKQIQNQIDKAKSEKDKQLAVKKQINSQVQNTQQQIEILTEQIALQQAEIEEYRLYIEQKETEIAIQMNLFKQRIRANYMAGNTSAVGLLLGAEDFSRFLTNAEITTRIAMRDREMIDQLNSDLRELNEIKKDLEEEEASLQEAQNTLEDKKSTLNTQLKTVESQIQDISALEAEYLANKKEIDEQMAQVQAEIDDIYATIQSEGEYLGGVMTWPVPGFTNVTSDYGWRFNGTDFHTGIDISGSNIYGKTIVAASGGRVAYVQISFTPGKGYGRYLIMDHGGGISTLYGHTSEILVDVGDIVTAGEAIARVGSTGWSTGPHLHFEVRVNGKYVNPWGYLRG